MYTSMPTSGDRLLETIALAYQYTPPQRGDATSVATMPYAPPLAPSLDRLPAFIKKANELDSCLAKSLVRTLDADIATNTIDLRAVEDSCKAQLSSRTRRPTRYFASTTLQTEGDTSVLAIRIIEHAITFLQDAYDRELSQLEQYPFPNQRPDRALAVDDSLRVIMEGKSWKVFEHFTPGIMELANSDAGRQLRLEDKEEHARAIIYKYVLAVAMSYSDTHWALVFGGDGAMLFQRCTSEEPSRYGLLCSSVLKWNTFSSPS
ncbi:hypothetical protein CPB85DRAFT_1557755 [Mucidula mucida]|nr:hypothetical protein CPB85DRAFT_1557755 [Mucidula mucida]